MKNNFPREIKIMIFQKLYDTKSDTYVEIMNNFKDLYAYLPTEV